METYDYQAFFCEENIWRLCRHPQLTGFDKRVVFVSNPARRCPVWLMRAREQDEPVIWDYHVFLLVRQPDWRVWDLDSLLGLAVPVLDYLSQSFRLLPGALAPWFRVVGSELFLDAFRSDRQHMRRGEHWLAEPPSWPAPSPEGEHNLEQWIEMEQPFFGEVYDLVGLARALAKAD